MSITEKLAQALSDMCKHLVRVMETGRDAIIDLGGECDTVEVMERGDPYLAKARAALAEYDASQSTPAGEVTADAAQIALNVILTRNGSSPIDDMQAALAAALPVLVQQVECLKGSLSQWVRRVQSAENERLRPDANRIEAIAAEYLHVVPFDMPTGQGDADVGWEVRQSVCGQTRDVVIVRHYKDDVRAALDEAICVIEKIPDASADMRKARSREAAQSMFDDIYDTAAAAQAKQAEGGS